MNPEAEGPYATAGAFVGVGQGRFVFATGPRRQGDALGIVRLGGHVEDGETPWECAARELGEEACLRAVERLEPPRTYRQPFGGGQWGPLEGMHWERARGPAPLVLKSGPQALSVLYLARTGEAPVPASEIRALIFLTPAEIRTLIQEAHSLERFLENGGKVRFNPRHAFDRALPLRPSSDLAAFVQIAAEHPEIMR